MASKKKQRLYAQECYKTLCRSSKKPKSRPGRQIKGAKVRLESQIEVAYLSLCNGLAQLECYRERGLSALQEAATDFLLRCVIVLKHESMLELSAPPDADQEAPSSNDGEWTLTELVVLCKGDPRKTLKRHPPPEKASTMSRLMEELIRIFSDFGKSRADWLEMLSKPFPCMTLSDAVKYCTRLETEKKKMETEKKKMEKEKIAVSKGKEANEEPLYAYDLLQRSLKESLVSLGWISDDGSGRDSGGLIDYSTFCAEMLSSIFDVLLSVRLKRFNEKGRVVICSAEESSDKGSDDGKVEEDDGDDDKESDEEGDRASACEENEDMTQTALGAFYTPPDLAIQVTRAAMASLIERLDNFASREGTSFDDFCEEIKRVRVLDPTVGSGTFLLAAFRELVVCCRRAANRLLDRKSLTKSGEIKKLGNVFCSIMDNCLYGVDVHPTAVAITRFALRSELSELAPRDASEGLRWHIVHGDSVLGCFSKTELLQGPKLTPELQEALGMIFPSDGNAISSTPFFQRLHDACEHYDSAGFKPCTRDHVKSVNFACWAESALFRDLCDAASRRMALASNAKDSRPGDGSPSESADEADSISGDGSPDEKFGWQSFFQSGLHWFLAFPDLFGPSTGKFDVVLGNPPWSVIRYQKSKSGIENKADRLAKFIRYDREMGEEVYHLGDCGWDICSCILQRALHSLKRNGALGMLLPLNILLDDYKNYDRKLLLTTLNVVQLSIFSARRSRDVFPAVGKNFVVIIGQCCDNDTKLCSVFRFAERSNLSAGEKYLVPLKEIRDGAPLIFDDCDALQLLHRSGAGEKNSFGDLVEVRGGSVSKRRRRTVDVSFKQDKEHAYIFMSAKMMDPFLFQPVPWASSEMDIKHFERFVCYYNPTSEARGLKYDGFDNAIPRKCNDIASNDVDRVAFHRSINRGNLRENWFKACVVEDTCLGENNSNFLWPRKIFGVPQDSHFFCALLNSFIFTLAGIQRFWVTIDFGSLRQLHLPLIDSAAPNTPSISIIDFQNIVEVLGKGSLDILTPLPDLFVNPLSFPPVADHPELNGRVLHLRSQSHAFLISLGAQFCQSCQKSRKCKRSTRPGSSWPSLDEQPFYDFFLPTNVNSAPDWWKKFRQAEVVLNHLVALWYGLNIEKYKSCCDAFKAHVKDVYNGIPNSVFSQAIASGDQNDIACSGIPVPAGSDQELMMTDYAIHTSHRETTLMNTIFDVVPITAAAPDVLFPPPEKKKKK